MSDLDTWESIRFLANELANQAAQNLDSPMCQPGGVASIRHQPSTLALPILANQSAFEAALRGCGLRDEQVASVVEIYQHRMEDTAQQCQSAYERDTCELASLEGSSTAAVSENALRTMYTRAFEATVSSSQRAVLSLVQGRQSTSRGLHTTLQEAGEHTPEAVALLYEAWERSPKPNAVERKRLAAATGLSSQQVGVWFNNRRQRGNKPYSRKRGSVSSGGKGKGSRAAPEDASGPPRPGMAPTPTRKVSSTPSLGSSTSSSSSSPSYNALPLQSFATPETIDRYLAGLRTPSPAPFPLPEQQQQQHAFAHHDYFSSYPISMLDTQKPAYVDPLSLLQQQHERDPSSQVTFPQNPTFDFSLPTLVVPHFEQVQLPHYDTSLLSNSALDFDLSAGIGDDFWASIMATAGMQPLAGCSQEQGSPDSMQQDQLSMLAGQPGCVIAPAADDWSHIFSSMDFSAFGQPQVVVHQEQ